MDSIANICRLCLRQQQDSNLHNLFGQNLISMKIMSLFQLTLMQGANWPQNVCGSCVDTLNEMCKFRKDVIDNQIHIEQKYGPVVLYQSSNVRQPSSFIAETSILVGTTGEEQFLVTEVKEVHSTPSGKEEETTPGVTRRRTRSSGGNKADTKPPLKEQKVEIEEDPALPDHTLETDFDLHQSHGEDLETCSNNTEDCLPIEDKEEAQKFTGKFKDVDKAIFDFLPLNCTLCPASSFKTFTQLRYHYTKEHSCKGFVMCCNIKHLRRHKLYEHIQYHLDPGTFKCPTCTKTFNSSHNLSTHVKMTHLTEAEKKHQCEKCDQKFGTPFQLKQHMIRHVGADEKSFKCGECSKMFPGRPHLHSHIRFVHEKQRKYACQHCHRTFTTKVLLENHLSAAHPDGGAGMRVQCHHCNKFFANELSMNKHLSRLNVTGEKHICPECGHESPNKSALRGHIYRNHNPKRQPLVCVTCGKQFKSTTTLNEHMAMHTGESLYCCLFCPKRFNSNANKYTHQKKKHPDEWAEENKRKCMDSK